MAGVSFGLLGPIKVWNGGDELEAGPPQQRGVLALLLLSEGRQVSLEEIVSALWGPEAPHSAVMTSRTYVSRLRRVLAGGPEIMSAGRGYQLAVDPGAVDTTVFRQTTAAARKAHRQGKGADSARLLHGALALWRGPALDGLSGAFFEGRRAWLERLRVSAMEDRWALDIERGDCAETIAELMSATVAEPYRERLWELLMWAYEREGRHGEALSAYQRIVQVLDDDLGLEPGPRLRRMGARIRAAAAGASLL